MSRKPDTQFLARIGYSVVPTRSIPQRYAAKAPDGKRITEPLLSKEAAWWECHTHFERFKPDLVLTTIGAKLRVLRGTRRQEQVAQDTGVHPTSISFFETNTREPSITQLARLVLYYGSTLSEFFENIEIDLTSEDSAP